MTDLEMTVVCAQAMGYENPRIVETMGGSEFVTYGPLDSVIWPQYWPLQYDPQAFAMVKKLHLHIDQRPGKRVTVQDPHFAHLAAEESDLNRAIVRCVAAMHRATLSKDAHP